MRVHATNGSDYYLQYLPSDVSPNSYGSYAIIPAGTQYKDGTWRQLNRDLDADLQSVFGVGVAYVKWFCIKALSSPILSPPLTAHPPSETD